MTDTKHGIDVQLKLGISKFVNALRSVEQRSAAVLRAQEAQAKAVREKLPAAFQKMRQAGEAAVGRLHSAFNKLRSFTTLIAAGIAGAFLRSLSKAAAVAQETESKFSVVFDGIRGDADATVDSIRSLGRATTEVRDAMAQAQNLFEPLGFAKDAAFELSEAVVRLGYDLASFHNQADDETLRLLQSAIVGNHEAVRRYGIQITQATVDLELLRLGFKTSAQGATEQQKVLARTNLIFKTSKFAIGDLERTQSSFTNQMKKLQSKVAEVRAELGDKLNAAILRTIDRMGGMDAVVSAVRLGFRVALDALMDFGSAIADLLRAITGQTDGMKAFRVVLLTIAAVVKTLAAGMKLLSVTVRGAVLLMKFEFEQLLIILEAVGRAILNFESPAAAFDKMAAKAEEYRAKAEELAIELETAGKESRAAWAAVADEMDGTAEKTREVQAAQKQAAFDAEKYADLLRDNYRANLKAFLTAEGEKQKAEAARLEESISATEAALEKKLDLERSHRDAIKSLEQERAKSFDDFEESAFRVGFEALGSVEEKIQAIRQRLSEYRQEANAAWAGNQFDEARAALQEIGTLTEELNGLEGGTNARTRQQDLMAIAREVDATFQRQIEAQQTLAEEARKAQVELQARLVELKTKQDAATEAAEAFNAKLKEVDDSPIEELKQTFAALTAEIEKAGAAAAAVKVKIDGTVLSSAGAQTPSGFARGGVNDKRDTIPAMLRPGETVLTPEQAKKMAPQLGAAGVPGYAAGGSSADFRSLKQGTRRYTDLMHKTQSFDAAAQRDAANRQFSSLAQVYGPYQAGQLMRQFSESRNQQGLPQLSSLANPGLSNGFLDNAQGFARGGRANGPGTVVEVGDIVLQFSSQGASQSDAVRMAAGLRRALQRNMATLS